MKLSIPWPSMRKAKNPHSGLLRWSIMGCAFFKFRKWTYDSSTISAWWVFRGSPKHIQQAIWSVEHTTNSKKQSLERRAWLSPSLYCSYGILGHWEMNWWSCWIYAREVGATQHSLGNLFWIFYFYSFGNSGFFWGFGLLDGCINREGHPPKNPVLLLFRTKVCITCSFDHTSRHLLNRGMPSEEYFS